MYKYLSIIVPVFTMMVAWSTAEANDRFDLLIERLNSAKCLSMRFVSVIKSDIFDDIDSTSGELYVASDGRFFLDAGSDQFLFDGSNIYTYSESANQVIIETPVDSESTSREFSFLLMLDRLYSIEPITPNREYQLRIKTHTSETYPDSMVVHIDDSDQILKRLEYYDINDELNTIIVNWMKLSTACRSSQFIPSFPDSVERVKL